MKNPWNELMKVDFDELHKKNIQEFVSRCDELKKNKRLDAIKNGLIKCNEQSQQYLKEMYEYGYGTNVLTRELKLSSTTKFRTLMKYLNIPMRKGYDVQTSITKKFKSERVKGNKNPFYGKKIENKNVGVQGYYYSKCLKKYVWLRSTWEYIYAKWLDNLNIKWDIEVQTYKLSDGTTYRPDFFIFENDNIKYIVEIKGYHKNMLYKTQLLKNEYNIDVVVIDDIKHYSTKHYRSLLSEWKNVRIFKNEKRLLIENKKY